MRLTSDLAMPGKRNDKSRRTVDLDVDARRSARLVSCCCGILPAVPLGAGIWRNRHLEPHGLANCNCSTSSQFHPRKGRNGAPTEKVRLQRMGTITENQAIPHKRGACRSKRKSWEGGRVEGWHPGMRLYGSRLAESLRKKLRPWKVMIFSRRTVSRA